MLRSASVRSRRRVPQFLRGRAAQRRAVRGLVLVLLLQSTCAISADKATAGDGWFDSSTQRVAAAPDNLLAGIELRRRCREQHAVERCIKFFDELAQRHPQARGTRYNASLAYVDNLPGLSLITQARLSTNSMAHASAVLEQAPNDWLALYIRGLNNLYWPLWYRRTDRAIADLKRCVELSEALPPEQRRPYMALAYLALGDVYARLERPSEARAVWSRGSERHSSEQLRSRLALAPDQVAQSVESIRSRDVPIDTDVSFYAEDGKQASAGAR
jgi:tetratricopeptide (TPR) repeat protein